MLTLGVALGLLARRIGLPRLFGELTAGVILGPTVLGSLDPATSKWMGLTISTHAIIDTGLVVFLFSVGTHVDLPSLNRLRRRIAFTSLGGMALPFGLGYAVVTLLPGFWRPYAQGNLNVLALFIGTVLSISALPVIAKILRDLDLLSTDTGSVIMAAATLDDLVGWSLFAVVVAELTHKGNPAAAIVSVVILALATVTIGRKIAMWLMRLAFGPVAMAVQMLVAFGVAHLTASLGLGAVFGAFLAGVAFSGGIGQDGRWKCAIDKAADELFAPLYFVSVGLQANFAHSFNLALCCVMLGVACVGKIVGATAGARLGGATGREALAVGFGLNARGAMAIVLASTALAAHVVTEPVFVAIVAMSLATSFISGPAMSRLVDRRPIPVASSDSAA